MKVRGSRRDKRKAERKRIKVDLHVDPTNADVPNKEVFIARKKGNKAGINKPIV